MSTSHSIELSLTVNTVFQDLMAWIQQTPQTNPIAPSPILNVAAFKVFSINPGLWPGNFAYGVLKGTVEIRALSGTTTILSDNLEWIGEEGWQGKPFGAVPVTTAAQTTLSLSNHEGKPVLSLSIDLTNNQTWNVSFASVSGSEVDNAVLQGSSNLGEQVDIAFSKTKLISGGPVGG
jgi:hypothetical protein